MHHGCGVDSAGAEQTATPPHLKILSIRDVQRWMAEEPVASCSSADAQRIREAVAVLSSPKPRQEDVEPLQSTWQVAQKRTKKRRPQGDVLQEFKGKVIEAAKKLQLELIDSAEQPATSSPEQLSKKLKREHPTVTSSAAQPASKKRPSDQREDAEAAHSADSTTDDLQRSSKQMRVIVPGAHPSWSPFIFSVNPAAG